MPTAVFLTPFPVRPDGTPGTRLAYPLALAGGLSAATGGRWRVEVLAHDPTARRGEVAPGVGLRTLVPAGNPRAPDDAVSWELPDAVAGADVLHLFTAFTRSADLGYLLGQLAGVPVCVTDLGPPGGIGRELGTLALAARVVHPSDFAATLLPTDRPTTTIRAGVEPVTVAGPRSGVVFAGDLLPENGADRLIRALPANLSLTCAGDAVHPEYATHLKTLAAGKRVTFAPPSGPDVLARAAAVVCPATYRDCFGVGHLAPALTGLDAVAALACGTPVVAARVGALPEVVTDGETGFLFDTEAELTAHLTRLATDPALVERLSRAARADARRRFDRRAAGAALAAVYDDLSAAQAAGAAA